jgi:hypothetical protein
VIAVGDVIAGEDSFDEFGVRDVFAREDDVDGFGLDVLFMAEESFEEFGLNNLFAMASEDMIDGYGFEELHAGKDGIASPTCIELSSKNRAGDDLKCRAAQVVRELRQRKVRCRDRRQLTLRCRDRRQLMIELGIDGVDCYVRKEVSTTKLKWHIAAARSILESQNKDTVKLDKYEKALWSELDKIEAAALCCPITEKKNKISSSDTQVESPVRRGEPRYDVGIPKRTFFVMEFPRYNIITGMVHIHPAEKEEQESDDGEGTDADGEDSEDRRSEKAVQAAGSSSVGETVGGSSLGRGQRDLSRRLMPVTEDSPEHVFTGLLESYKKLDHEKRYKLCCVSYFIIDFVDASE